MCPTLPQKILWNLSRKIPMQKYYLTPALSRAAQGVKLPFLSKKRIFGAEKGIFSKSSFYTKFISDSKYSFSVGQKCFFVVPSKVSIFHQILPTHTSPAPAIASYSRAGLQTQRGSYFYHVTVEETLQRDKSTGPGPV